MAFFGLLALFPLLLLLIALFSFLVKTSDATALVLGRIVDFFPGSAAFVFNAIDAVTAAQPAYVGVGLVGLLWASMGAFMSMGYALNRVWDLPTDRNIAVQYVIAASLALSVGVLVTFSFVLAVIVNLVFLLADRLVPIGIPLVGGLTVAASDAVDLVIVLSASAMLYKWLPNTAVLWRHVLLPTIVVTTAWECAKVSFTWYLGTIAHVDRVYGPIAAVAGLMLWMFISSILFLFGAEMCHQIALVRDRTA